VNDPGYASQWHLPLMGAPSAWAYANGKGITVAVCDTGVNAGHPDLAGQTVPGWNTASDSPDTSDVHGHGTMVSGVIAAAANNLVGGRRWRLGTDHDHAHHRPYRRLCVFQRHD